jgi:hypothetical protein
MASAARDWRCPVFSPKETRNFFKTRVFTKACNQRFALICGQ